MKIKVNGNFPVNLEFTDPHMSVFNIDKKLGPILHMTLTIAEAQELCDKIDEAISKNDFLFNAPAPLKLANVEISEAERLRKDKEIDEEIATQNAEATSQKFWKDLDAKDGTNWQDEGIDPLRDAGFYN
jgi:hypothetical protein